MGRVGEKALAGEKREKKPVVSYTAKSWVWTAAKVPPAFVLLALSPPGAITSRVPAAASQK